MTDDIRTVLSRFLVSVTIAIHRAIIDRLPRIGDRIFHFSSSFSLVQRSRVEALSRSTIGNLDAVVILLCFLLFFASLFSACLTFKCFTLRNIKPNIYMIYKLESLLFIYFIHKSINMCINIYVCIRFRLLRDKQHYDRKITIFHATR